MTNITIKQNGKHVVVKADNHADRSDICTSVSTLLCTLDGAIRNNEDAVCWYSDLKPGRSRIEFLAAGELAMEDLRMAVIGFLQLQESFPDSVKVDQNIFS